ncbi:MAG: hypothetical protein SV775_15435 [Thermodesulfobacteriota bacterium]|nr:hypothetical protein [Thermodesulfobacteriota bacterium]
MDNKAVLGHLEALAHALGIQIRYERLEGDTAFPSGGLCRIKDKQLIIVNLSATTGEKVQTLVGALRRFDLSRIYVKPALRDILEESIEDY